ncbi:hypothetical protein [Methanoculleus sp.]|uniref:hypothetical protein n=1 Tax=Methanoculleus sp. TaxID=90427 RepID=UPI0025EDA43A|nr:hypothetical protein [Methanoculleus sp.]MCK9320059.1 hypothetical protein [Methanoculleus sp.]
MKHLKTPQQLDKASENLNISDVSDSSLNSIENAKKFLDNLGGFIYNIFDEDNHLDRTELSKILVQYAESLK